MLRWFRILLLAFSLFNRFADNVKILFINIIIDTAVQVNILHLQ